MVSTRQTQHDNHFIFQYYQVSTISDILMLHPGDLNDFAGCFRRKKSQAIHASNRLRKSSFVLLCNAYLFDARASACYGCSDGLSVADHDLHRITRNCFSFAQRKIRVQPGRCVYFMDGTNITTLSTLQVLAGLQN